MLNLWHDGRAAVKSLTKTPRLTGMALACLVVGLGATLSMLTLINALLIRPPPFPEADRLVRVWASIERVSPRYGLSYLDYLDVRQLVHAPGGGGHREFPGSAPGAGGLRSPATVAAAAAGPGVEPVGRDLRAFLISVYTASAVLLAVLGIYGILSNEVARRIGELGLRMALGAERGDILRLVIGQGLRPVAIGVAGGALAAFAVLRLIASLLYGVTARDPETFLLTALGLALVAAIACIGPAMRAMRLDPANALREE